MKTAASKVFFFVFFYNSSTFLQTRCCILHYVTQWRSRDQALFPWESRLGMTCVQENFYIIWLILTNSPAGEKWCKAFWVRTDSFRQCWSSHFTELQWPDRRQQDTEERHPFLFLFFLSLSALVQRPSHELRQLYPVKLQLQL